MITAGRIVNFVVDEQTANEFNRRGDGNPVAVGDVLPAIVVKAWGSDLVNLRVLRDAATDGWVRSVPQQTATNPALRTWCWPPRQAS